MRHSVARHRGGRGPWRVRGLRALGLAALVAGPACGPGPPDRPPDVVLISLDTTRADHIGAYGSQVRTPAIDRVASEGVVFENASSPGTTTLPAHVSMLTGLWPTRHGVVRNGYLVNEANRMLPEILAEAGYDTAGISAAVALSEILRFPQGFAHWDQDPEGFEGHVVANRRARDAGEITDATLAFLNARSSRAPLFLFVHYVDPHAPYAPPERYRELYGEVPPELDGSHARIRRVRGRPDRVEGEPLAVDRHLAALYAGEVTYMDAQVGRLLEGLRRHGLYEDALLVVTSDHGETFWEHPEDLWSHGRDAHQTTVDVPLILRLPGGRRAGERVAAPVSTVDLTPTLLELLSLPVPPDLDGVSLVAGMAGDPHARAASYSQAPLRATRLENDAMHWKNRLKPHSVRVGRWKLIRTPYQGRTELYDLAADPHERENLLASDAPEVARRRRELKRTLHAWMSRADPLASEFFPRKKPEGTPDAVARRAMWERLRAMGYVVDGDGDL